VGAAGILSDVIIEVRDFLLAPFVTAAIFAVTGNKFMIEVSHISHHYGVKPVLQDVTLSVGAGELVALMGPNGMGKSTLMAIMAGVLWPLKGYVEIDGKRRRSNEENELAIRQKVVYLTAEPWLPSLRTGRQGGVELTLEDAYQNAVNPHTLEKFQRYLETAGQ
jgi:ABC-type nitrate/sulfonate/bicarbonate transport system ATPase subunit